MSRKEYIKSLEKLRGSKVICYVTGDRNPFTTRIADDVVPLFEEHLSQFSRSDSERVSMVFSLERSLPAIAKVGAGGTAPTRG